MNKNILIVLAGGFLVAILVAVLLQAVLGGKEKEVDTNRIQILVAAKNLEVGHELKTGDLKWQVWPEDTVFGGAIIRDGEQLPLDAVNGKLLRSLVESQPLHMTLVSEEDRGNFLSANISKGMRAVSISMRSYRIAERMVRPGDYIDVMVTYRVRVNARKNPEAQSVVSRYATETILEKVRILAVDTNDTKAVDEEEGEDGKKKKKRGGKKATLTLEVTPEGAEKIVLADRMGDIGVSLRSIGDENNVGTDLTTTDIGLSRVMTKLSNMRGTGAGSAKVRIYNGDQLQDQQARSSKVEETIDFGVEGPTSIELREKLGGGY